MNNSNIVKNSFEKLVDTWQRCYAGKGIVAKQFRLKELTTWDKPRKDNQLEHAAKIQALKNLLAKAESK